MTDKSKGSESRPDVEAAPEGSGRRDGTAPIKGGELRTADLTDILKSLPKADRAKAASEVLQMELKVKPEFVAASKSKRRENIRLALTIVIFLIIVAEAAAAIYLTSIAKTQSWDTIKDWLVIALAPFIAAATVASTFWFPSREAD